MATKYTPSPPPQVKTETRIPSAWHIHDNETRKIPYARRDDMGLKYNIKSYRNYEVADRLSEINRREHEATTIKKPGKRLINETKKAFQHKVPQQNE